jgi:hypothetical protein
MKNIKKKNIFNLINDMFFFGNTKLTVSTILCLSAFFILYISNNISNILLADADEPKTEVVFSGSGLQGGAKLVEDNIQGVGIVESGSIVETIIFIVKYVIIIAGILAFIAFIWAGFLYITTFMNDDNTEQAKKTMIYAAVGIIIILFSWVIVDFLTTLQF